MAERREPPLRPYPVLSLSMSDCAMFHNAMGWRIFDSLCVSAALLENSNIRDWQRRRKNKAFSYTMAHGSKTGISIFIALRLSGFRKTN